MANNRDSSNKKKISLIAIPVAAVFVIAAAGIGTNLFGFYNPTEASDKANCLPSTVENAAVTAFPVKESTSLPNDYALRAVEADGGGKAGVILYYADHSLCPFEGSLTDQIRNETLVILIGASDIENGEDFQKREVDFYENDNQTLAKVQAIEVGGHKGVGWEPFEGQNVIRIDGKVVESTPMQQPGMVRYFDESDKTIYTITALRPMNELIAVAESIK